MAYGRTSFNAHKLVIKDRMNNPFFILFLVVAFRFPSTTDPIRLRSESLPFSPKEFYIAAVTDQRPDRGPIARLALVLNQPPQPVDLEKGVAASFQQFIDQGLKQNKTLRPIAMRIRQCQISETAKGNRVSGQFMFAVTFELLGKTMPVPTTSTRLTDYQGSATYTRPLGHPDVVEPTIRQALVASIRSLNEYMKRESGRNEKLARSLKINFIDDTRITDDDTVHYNPARKLTWADFQAEPRKGSHYAAEVFTSFAYEGKSSVKTALLF